MTRLARLASVDASTDVRAQVLDYAVRPRRARWGSIVRIGLVLVALAQLAVGLGGLLAPAETALAGTQGHVGYERAAFNIAIGALLLWAAARLNNASDPLAVLGTFVLVLLGLSVADLVRGDVGWARIATHAPVLAGLVLLAVLAGLRSRSGDPRDEAARAPRDSEEQGSGTYPAESPEQSRARVDGTMPPAARRDVA